jgi:hypothetical protein
VRSSMIRLLSARKVDEEEKMKNDDRSSHEIKADTKKAYAAPQIVSIDNLKTITRGNQIRTQAFELFKPTEARSG